MPSPTAPSPAATHPLVGRRGPAARSTVRVDDHFVGPTTLTVVAGPCAVESYEQTTAACAGAASAGATMLRGDLYKHRTSPYSFQGVGAGGVEIIAAMRAEHHLPWVAEILDARDLDVIADVVDVLRVGARNMQNFELLRACAKSGKPIMLKRGLSATIEEWLLAAEYVADSGSLDVILCERGIRTFEPSTRNTLDLSAVPVVQARSHLPVIVDPSHGTGRRELVAPMALAAVAAGADGVMLDVHCDPDAARCDGPQALRPSELAPLAARLAELARWAGRREA